MELATASWDFLTIWELAAEIAGKKKVFPAKYRNERKMDKKTLSKVKSITTTTTAIVELAQIMSFLRSTKSAASPAAAIKMRLGIVSESMIPETEKLLPVFKKTEEIKEIIKKPEAICPKSKVRVKRKKLRHLAISVKSSDKESMITTSGSSACPSLAYGERRWQAGQKCALLPSIFWRTMGVLQRAQGLPVI